jgi:ElaB/YqjD/DUF883 family membrane-anchored ribosome-binding protein
MAVARARRRAKNGNGRDVQARLESLKADLDALQQDMRGLVGDVGTMAGDQMQGAMNGAMESAQDVVDRLNEWNHDNLDGVRTAVRAQPLAACMLSMSAGAVIGALLLR